MENNDYYTDKEFSQRASRTERGLGLIIPGLLIAGSAMTVLLYAHGDSFNGEYAPGATANSLDTISTSLKAFGVLLCGLCLFIAGLIQRYAFLLYRAHGRPRAEQQLRAPIAMPPIAELPPDPESQALLDDLRKSRKA